jgi:hypothetical protein
LDDLAGIAIDGVIIKSSTAEATAMDPIYPRKWTRSKDVQLSLELDACLGSVDPDLYTYSYSMLPPCLKSFSANQDKLCRTTQSCVNNIKEYSINAYSWTAKEPGFTLLGLAKDGHMIIGPYLNGEKIDCSTLD